MSPRPSRPGRAAAAALACAATGVVASAALAQTQAQPPSCAADALGTARVLTLPRVAAAYGSMQHACLPLGPKEVVLSFDDGPQATATPAVLAALRAQCVRATFLLNGVALAQNPQLARDAQAQGHSLGLHGHTHESFAKMTPEAQRADIDANTAVYRRELGREPAVWRYPFLAESPESRRQLAAARLTILSADLGIEDWVPAPSAQALAQRLFDRLDKEGGGIVLLHDAQAQTAESLPLMLSGLRQRGWRVVHLEWEDR